MYTIVNDKFVFNAGVKVLSGESKITFPSYISSIDFADVEHIKGMLDLSGTSIRCLDLKNVLTAEVIFLPAGCSIKENLYWAQLIEYRTGGIPKERISSKRLKNMNMYRSKPLIYLSGTIKGYLDLRKKQTEFLLNEGYGVYDPGNHITFGDPVADSNPEFVYKLDMLALNRSDIIVFDLNNLSPGTSAELGYVISKLDTDYKHKRVIVFNEKPIVNFFIKGLINHANVERYTHLDKFVMLDKLKKELGFMQKLPYKWWKNPNYETPKIVPIRDVPVGANNKLCSNPNRGDYLTKKLKVLDKDIQLKKGIPNTLPLESYFYAINTEILELLVELNSPNYEPYSKEVVYEMVDIIIFITLIFKNYGYENLPMLLKGFVSRNTTHIFLTQLDKGDLVNWSYLIRLYLFLVDNVNLEDIKSKLVYNGSREDHL